MGAEAKLASTSRALAHIPHNDWLLSQRAFVGQIRDLVFVTPPPHQDKVKDSLTYYRQDALKCNSCISRRLARFHPYNSFDRYNIRPNFFWIP